MSRKQHGDLALFRRLLGEVPPYGWHIAGILFLYLLAAPLNLLYPLPLKLALDSVLGDEPLPGWLAAVLPEAVTSAAGGLLLFTAGLIVLIALVIQVQGLACSVLYAYTGEHLVLRFRARLFQHVQRLSLTYHDRRGTADALYRIQYDAKAIEGALINGVIPLISAVVTLLAMIYVTVRIDWQLALLALAVVPVLGIVAQIYRRPLRTQWDEAKRLESTVLAVIEEVLTTLRVVKAFGQERREEARFRKHASQGIQARIRALVTQGVFALLLALTISGGSAAVLYLGVRHVQNGILSLGDLVLVMFYLGMLYKPIETIGTMVGMVQSALASADRAYTLLEAAPDVVERPDARPVHRALGAVTFRNVSFAYDPDRPVLHDVSFEVAPGACIGIAGPTGAGKTTLVNLLPRITDPTNGQVLLDGVDLRDYKLTDLRRQFSIVLQDPVLFSTSIAENIAYGRPEASMAEIEAAARAANAHGFITKLADGYETRVGERGMSLSGGQRQLVSLARAFLHDAPLLILDEPTSSVDIGTESIVMEALQRLQEGRTTFMIAHRLSTLTHCDEVLVLEHGRLVRTETTPVNLLSSSPSLSPAEPLL